ncbi:hypothetical protein Fcan01_11376 [Folsomia candida]|uniref:Uncharacterized protein n=1 Tax=Folsomia candida TaxID=158441 RepID=A0A226E9L1_FOLCA|nr:hypothetical protein Fcan01_11376 [Folsomia candida]
MELEGCNLAWRARKTLEKGSHPSNPDSRIQILTSRKDQPLLSVDGNLSQLDRKASTKKFWQCAQFQNHDQDSPGGESLAADELITQELKQMPDGSQGHMPKAQSIKRSIKRVRGFKKRSPVMKEATYKCRFWFEALNSNWDKVMSRIGRSQFPRDGRKSLAELVTGKSRIGIQVVGTVELYLVIDFAMQQLFNGDPTRIIEYLALYVKSNTASQGYIEQRKLPGGLAMAGVLQEFSM